MKKISNTYKAGISMFLAIVAYFFIIHFIGLDNYTELRFLNVIITVFFSNRLAHSNLLEIKSLDYLDNLWSVFLANAMNVFLCSIGFLLYLNFINPSFVKVIENGFLLGSHLTIGNIVLAIFVEGMASSVVVAFGVLQYWKNYKSVFKDVDLSKF